MRSILRMLGLRANLSTRFASQLALVFLLLAAVISVLDIFWVDRLVIHNTTERMSQNIRAAWQVLDGQKKQLELIVAFLSEKPEVRSFAPGGAAMPEMLLEGYRKRWALNILTMIPITALEQKGFKGFLPPALNGESMTSGFAMAAIDNSGDNPRLSASENGEKTMLLYAARTISDAAGQLTAVMIAGIDLRQSSALVDKMQNVIFQDTFYKGKRVGTVTIFLGEERIATTVLLESGQRAIGTQVSEEVALKTLRMGVPWSGRAKVVNDWYLTRYDPIRSLSGHIIGMLYVGELEEVSLDIRRNTVLTTLGVIFSVMALALWFRLRATGILVRQILALKESTQRFAEGDYSARVQMSFTHDEIGRLARSFNAMAQVIEQDRAKLMAQKQEIERINANYMEMLGFVTHELRSTLGSALFNVVSLKEGVYGELIGDQKEGLDLVEESLSYLEEITNNYLQLSRIEKGELFISKTQAYVRIDIIEPILSGLKRLWENRRMEVKVNVPDHLAVAADVNLLRVVYENLIGNAVKYGCENGHIVLGFREEADWIWLDVWNDGKAIEQNVLPTLFRKFRRYDVDETSGRKGTGLGLFIVKQIITVHGGEVRVESDPASGTRFSFSLPR